MKQRAASRAELFGDTYRAVVERIAANVRRLRDLRGWTQEEAAHQCNDLDLTLWRMVESGRTNITAATLARLVDGFAVDVGELFAPAPPLEKRRPGRPRKVERAENGTIPVLAPGTPIPIEAKKRRPQSES